MDTCVCNPHKSLTAHSDTLAHLVQVGLLDAAVALLPPQPVVWGVMHNQ